MQDKFDTMACYHYTLKRNLSQGYFKNFMGDPYLGGMLRFLQCENGMAFILTVSFMAFPAGFVPYQLDN